MGIVVESTAVVGKDLFSSKFGLFPSGFNFYTVLLQIEPVPRQLRDAHLT